jgi:hypothetical protein
MKNICENCGKLVDKIGLCLSCQAIHEWNRPGCTAAENENSITIVMSVNTPIDDAEQLIEQFLESPHGFKDWPMIGLIATHLKAARNYNCTDSLGMIIDDYKQGFGFDDIAPELKEHCNQANDLKDAYGHIAGEMLADTNFRDYWADAGVTAQDFIFNGGR